MKRLSIEEIQNLTIEKAFEIIQDYGGFFAENKILLEEFDDKLPWPKDQILLAGLHLLEYMRENQLTEDDDKFIVQMNSLLISITNFIPTPEDYNQKLKFMEEMKKRSSS